MLQFAQQPPARPALRSIEGGKSAALDTPEKTIQACLKAGVELVATGVEDGATGLVARREKGAGGRLPGELGEAIRNHRTALIARLLGDLEVADESAPEQSRGKTLRGLWGEQAMLDQAKYGHRAARLYAYIDEQVWTPHGTGKLINVLGGMARVLLDRDVSRAVAKAAREGKKKPTLAMVDVPIRDVYPATAGAVGAGRERERGAVADLGAVRRNRHDDQDAEVGEDIYFPPAEDEPVSDPYASYDPEDEGDGE